MEEDMPMARERKREKKKLERGAKTERGSAAGSGVGNTELCDSRERQMGWSWQSTTRRRRDSTKQGARGTLGRVRKPQGRLYSAIKTEYS